MNWPNATGAASSAISPKRACRPARSLDGFDFDAVPMISKAQVMAVAAGDAWLATGANLLLFGPPAAARAISRRRSAWRSWRTAGRCCSPAPPTSSRNCRWPDANSRSKRPSTKLDRFDLLILDDLAYVTKDQAETSVLFELISARYERRSMLITANQPFGEWDKVFPDPAMTLAAVDRLVHHATIFEMNVESYRRRVALERKRGPGRHRPARQSKPRLIDAPRQSNRENCLHDDVRNRPSSHSPRHHLSHPDCRCALIKIAALQTSDLDIVRLCLASPV